MFGLVNTINGLVVLVVSISAGTVAELVGSQPIVIAAGCLHLLPLVVAFLLLRRFPQYLPMHV
jgi:hypothetical protein